MAPKPEEGAVARLLAQPTEVARVAALIAKARKVGHANLTPEEQTEVEWQMQLFLGAPRGPAVPKQQEIVVAAMALLKEEKEQATD